MVAVVADFVTTPPFSPSAARLPRYRAAVANLQAYVALRRRQPAIALARAQNALAMIDRDGPSPSPPLSALGYKAHMYAAEALCWLRRAPDAAAHLEAAAACLPSEKAPLSVPAATETDSGLSPSVSATLVAEPTVTPACWLVNMAIFHAIKVRSSTLESIG